MSKERPTPNAENPATEPALSMERLAAQVAMLAAQVGHLIETGPTPDTPEETPAGEEVDNMAEQEDSIIVKAGAKTYFFDLKQTRNDKPYLLITESRFKGEGEERERISISIFPENAAPFGQAVADMVTRLDKDTAE